MEKTKLLVVDDDTQFLSGLCLRLKASGYEVLPANDGMQAVAIARRERPDLIILDIGLPGGDGYVVMERLRSVHSVALTPIIVLSAKDRNVHEEKALKAGANAFFEKPVDNYDLLAAISVALGPGGQG